MASLGVGITAAAYSWNPVLAFGAMAVASYVDQRYLYPSLLGDGNKQAKARPLVGLPTTTTGPGYPRVWAVGRRIRVPLHVLYQSEKTREDTIDGPKGGVPNTIKRVFADLGFSVNDRQTNKLTQLIANGQLIYWRDKNLVRITTDQMTASFTTTTVLTGTVAALSTTTQVNSVVAGMVVDTYAKNYRWLQITSGALSGQARPINSNTAGQFTVDWAFTSAPAAGVTYSVIEKRMTLTMNSLYEPDFNDYLSVGDIVRLDGFDYTPATSGITQGGKPSWWRVNAVTPHGSSTSNVILEAVAGQDLGLMTAATAGSDFLPASVVREDTYWLLASVHDPLVYSSGHVTLSTSIATSLAETHVKRWNRYMGPATFLQSVYYDWERLSGAGPTWGALANGTVDSVFRYSSTSGGSGVVGGPKIRVPGLLGSVGLRARCANNTAYLIPADVSGFESRMFGSNPIGWFYNGSETQTENEILLRSKTGGQIPGYRGLAYQMLDQWDLSTYFGNQVPPIIEAIIEPDQNMTLPQAILEICERADSKDLKFDTSAVNVQAFEGYWTQGAIPTVTALQPIFAAFEIVGQERNDTLAFFSIENADSVQIENGASFSDLGVQSGAGTPFSGDKMRITQRDIADLPTSVGVTHQDPDQQYAQGFQHFKQRQPSPLPSSNEQTVQLDNLVLSRKQARNIAGTLLRRAWVNATSIEFQLPVAYCELLENDLVTLTDDEQQDYVARVVRREIGNNYVVNCYAVLEDVNLAVRGSPVQSSSDISIGTVSPVTPVARVLDIPPLTDADSDRPGYYIGACSPVGSAWNGVVVYESRDSGNTWQQVGVLNNECGIGSLTTSLPSGVQGDNLGSVAWDTANSFDVRVDDVGQFGAPFTVTTTDVLNGFNWMLVEDGSNFEILGARDVVDNGDGTYTFSYLVRGLRGTNDSAATTKASGSKVTFLFQARQQDAIKFVPLNVSSTSFPFSLQLKFVPTGASLIDVTAESVSIYSWNARPMPGRMFTTELDLVTYDRNFVFDYWTRLQTPVGGGSGVYNLDESFEGYSVRIYDPTGVTLQRTKTITSQATGSNRIRGDRSVPYTAAEQTADGYTPGSSTTFKVERVQLGDFGEGRSWLEDV